MAKPVLEHNHEEYGRLTEYQVFILAGSGVCSFGTVVGAAALSFPPKVQALGMLWFAAGAVVGTVLEYRKFRVWLRDRRERGLPNGGAG